MMQFRFAADNIDMYIHRLGTINQIQCETKQNQFSKYAFIHISNYTYIFYYKKNNVHIFYSSKPTFVYVNE